MATLSPSVFTETLSPSVFSDFIELVNSVPLYTSLAWLHNNDSDCHSNSITCSELWNTRWIKHLTTKWDWNLKTVMDDVSCCAFTTAGTRFEADIDCTARCEIEFPQLSHTHTTSSKNSDVMMVWSSKTPSLCVRNFTCSCWRNRLHFCLSKTPVYCV